MNIHKMKHWSVAFLGLLLIVSCGSDEQSVPQESGNPVISLQELTDAPNRMSFVGREVEFTDVRVQDVVGDYIFWAGERYRALPFVLESEAHGEAGESDLQIRTGQSLSIKGYVRLVETIAPDSELWHLIDDAEKAEIQSAVIYISTSDVRLKSRSLADGEVGSFE